MVFSNFRVIFFSLFRKSVVFLSTMEGEVVTFSNNVRKGSHAVLVLSVGKYPPISFNKIRNSALSSL